MDTSKTLIIIPVYNEAFAIPYVLNELAELSDIEVLVIDDASTDNSLAVCLSRGVKVLPLKVRLGAWSAMQTGLRYAQKHGYNCVVTMDGDGQHHSCEVPKLLKAANSNPSADVVVGECIERGSRLRHLAWRFFRKITGVGIKDITSGFRLYRKHAISLLAEKEATILDYQDIGILLMLRAAGINIIETRVAMTRRISGKSHLFSSWYKVAYYMMISTMLSFSKYGKITIRK